VKTVKQSVAGCFVALDCLVKGTLKFAQQIEAKEHGQES
jgi:hypothetical protein